MNKSEFDTELFHRSFKKMPHINFDEALRKITVDVENKNTNSDHGPVIFYAEESSELQEILTRIVRNRIDKDDSDLYQEMADVLMQSKNGCRWMRRNLSMLSMLNLTDL